MNTTKTLEADRLSQHKCYHIIPCAVSEEVRKMTISELEDARVKGNSFKVLIAIAQLTGPCVIED